MTRIANLMQEQQDNLNQPRVLVTGASGFVGRAVAAAFVRAGYRVRAAIRDAARVPETAEIAIIPDLREAVDWSPFVRDIDIVVHVAGLAHADASNANYGPYAMINWINTQRLARVAKLANVSRFVFLSTIRAQIGASSPHAVRETDEPLPTDHYGRSKLAAEQAIMSTGVPYTILRPVAIYGPNPRGNVKTLVRVARSPLPLPIKNLEIRRSLLGIDNLIDAIFFSIRNPATINETFLLADQEVLTVPQTITELRTALGRRPDLFQLSPSITRSLLAALGKKKIWSRVAEELVADTGKFQALGWRSPVATRDGLRAMLGVAPNERDQ